MVVEQFAVLAGFMLVGGIGGLMLSRILRGRSAKATAANAGEADTAPDTEAEPTVVQAADDGAKLTDAPPSQLNAKADGEPEMQPANTAETMARMECLLKHIAEAQLALNDHVTSGGANDRLTNRISEVSGTVRAISEMLVAMSAKLDRLSTVATGPGDDDAQISNAADDDVDLIATSEVDDTDTASGDHADEPRIQTSQSGDSAEVAILCQFPTVIPVHMGNAGSTVGDYS